MRIHASVLLPAFLTGVLLAFAGCASPERAVRRSPWDLQRLAEPPPASWGAVSGRLQELYYQGEPFQGRPTRIFAYLGRPAHAGSDSARPAVVLVHGGGGKAFPEWADHWAARGYFALAMDLAGNGPQGRLPDGGPDQSDAVKFREFGAGEEREMWTYHAVSAVIRGHSLLRSVPGVDARRTGVTGISWGGYLTCIVAGLDPRFQAAVPVYGCGHLGENSYWVTNSLAAMTPASRDRWLKLWDPSVYLPAVSRPILFLNGTTDFAYPLDSYQKSYRHVPETLRHLSVVVDLPHGHIWTFPEVDAFMDGALDGGTGFPRLGVTEVKDRLVAADLKSPLPVVEALLCYTTDTGHWQARKWRTAAARMDGGRVVATLPEGARVVYLAIKDTRGLRASSEHAEIRD